MSKRNCKNSKGSVGAKASAAAISKQLLADSNSKIQPKRRKYLFASVAVGLLLAFGVLGATINIFISSGAANDSTVNGANISGDAKSRSWLGAIFPTSPPLPTPYLDRQNIYAGGKLVAVETNGTTGSTPSPTASDLVVWRPTTGTWWIKDSTTGLYTTNQFGGSTDMAAPGDFDGDGLTDFSLYRPNTPSAGNATWFIQPNSQASTPNYSSLQFGLNTDVPVPADYDGDGRADIAVWRNSNNRFYILQSSNNSLRQVVMGQSGDQPVPADYDGDGAADPAVYHAQDSTWQIRQSTDGQVRVQPFGDGTLDVPVRGDYDGDGKFDLAIRRDSSAGDQWGYLRSSDGQVVSFQLQPRVQSGDVTVTGDYDADGRTDAAVWRPSNGVWYIRKSSDGQMRADQWGMEGDTPIAAPMKR